MESVNENTSENQAEIKNEVELFTAPAPVSRNKLGYGTTLFLQTIFALSAGIFLWASQSFGAENANGIAEALRRILNG